MSSQKKHRPYPQPPPAGITIDQRPSNDLRPDNEHLIQPYIDKERQEVWVYLPESVNAEFAKMLGRAPSGFRYWRAINLHILVLEQIRQNGQDAAPSILSEIKEATTNGLNAGIKYISDLTGRPPFNGPKVDDYLLKLWRWKAALTHGKIVKVYLGYSPYCRRSSDWSTKPAYQGIYYFDHERGAHFIYDGFCWASFDDPEYYDIQARLAIIEEVREEDDANMNQETPA